MNGLRLSAVVLSVVVLALSGRVSAALISLDGTADLHGTGFGNTLVLLSVQNNPDQWGTILPDGAPLSPPTSGHEKAISATRSVGGLGLHGIGAGNFALVLNINQPQAPARRAVQLREFTLRFYTDPADLGQFFDATFTAPDASAGLVLESAGEPGSGTAGWLFRVQFSAAEAADFFGNPANRVGMFVPASHPMSSAFGGPESFFIVPEPAGLSALAIGLALLIRRRR